MKTNRPTAIQIAAISFAITSAIGINHLNRKPQLTPHQARTHQLLLDTYQAASRALLFPALLLPPSPNKPDKHKPDKHKPDKHKPDKHKPDKHKPDDPETPPTSR